MGATPPVTPSDFAAAVIQPGDKVCTFVGKVTSISKLLSDWFGWAINADGTPTRDFLDWAGASGGTGLSAPSNVTATSNNSTKVQIGWGPVEGATAYRVFRGLTSDTRLMQQVGADVEGATTFDDSTGDVDTVYYYAVKAFNATLTSGFSGTASGKKVSSTDPVDAVIKDISEPGISDESTITVPEGKDRMEIELWGGGGKGGNGAKSGWVPVAPGGVGSPVVPGGGGASGSYYHRTAVVVTPGEQFVATPGGPSQESRLTRSDGTEAVATAGGDGKEGAWSNTASVRPGDPASSAGYTTFATGSAGAGTRVGNPGDGASGGAAVVDAEGYGRGAGGAGSAVKDGTGSPGIGGRIRVKFTTA